MWTNNRPKLIKDLTHSALGLIAEAENASPEQAHDLVELAGSLDRLRVKLISEQQHSMPETRFVTLQSVRCA